MICGLNVKVPNLFYGGGCSWFGQKVWSNPESVNYSSKGMQYLQFAWMKGLSVFTLNGLFFYYFFFCLQAVL